MEKRGYAAVSGNRAMEVSQPARHVLNEKPGQKARSQVKNTQKPQATKQAVSQHSAASCELSPAEQMTPRGSEHPHDSPQKTAILETRGTESGTVARIVELFQQLTPAEQTLLVEILTNAMGRS